MGSYKSCQDRTGSSGSSSSTNTNDSDHSKSTAQTIVSDRIPSASKRTAWHDFKEEDEGPRDSISTYVSSTGSIEKLTLGGPHYEVEDRPEGFPTDTLASTPTSFAGLFPSSRRLLIRHDDTTLDGNMNLRVDTVVPRRGGHQRDVILFHLRMYDLYLRKFSLRRYCRDSGREVCHSSRKEVPTGSTRPVLRRSWSSVLSSLRPGSSGQHTQHSSLPTESSKWHDSRHGVRKEENADATTGEAMDRGPALADTIQLEFSNYAHVELRRRGGPSAAKGYEYEYWSTKYQWRLDSHREGDLREVSYYLVNTRTARTVAHLVPEILAPLVAIEEESKGGWVPPCSLWLSDSSVYDRMPDVAE